MRGMYEFFYRKGATKKGYNEIVAMAPAIYGLGPAPSLMEMLKSAPKGHTPSTTEVVRKFRSRKDQDES